MPEFHELLMVGNDSIDKMHREFYTILQALQNSVECDIEHHLETLVSHLKGHFAAEEQLMLETGYPDMQCHKGEHDEVLLSAIDLLEKQKTQGIKMWAVHNFAVFLSRWFEPHVAHLDSSVAAWVSKRRYGGVPIVMKRGVSQSAVKG